MTTQHNSNQQKTVFECILEWSLSRPIWQRDTLRRIIAKGRLDDHEIAELTEICKQARAGNITGIQPIPLEKNHLPANPTANNSVSLLSIKDVVGVNNLALSQTLYFEPNGLTVIYGDNGAGKSGYARILKRACRARHQGNIHPNIYAQGGTPPALPSAALTYSIGGIVQTSETWQNSENPHPIFSAVSVFDSKCAAVHIDEKNEVAFRPFGLDVPDELASVCQRVKDSLSAEQKQLEKARNPVFSAPTWKNYTAVGKILASLDHNTDIDSVSALGTLSEDETARLMRLREDLSKNPATATAEQKNKADNIKGLLNFITLVSNQTTDEGLQRLFNLSQDAKLKRKAARIAAERAFSGESLKDIGGEVWWILWEAARHYYTHNYPAQLFPPSEEALCVLCQQPLTSEARQRMTRFEDFIKNDAEQHALEAENIFKVAYQKLMALNFDIRPLNPNHREIALQRPDLAKKTLRFIASARLRRYTLVKALKNATELHLPVTVQNPKESLEQLEKTIRDYALELGKSASGEERKKLEKDSTELSDREILRGIMPTVKEEINRLKGIHFLGECISDTTTNAITKLGNDVADTVITPKLRDKFQEEIVKLAAEKVRVEMVRSGGKFGSPQYQIRLFAKPDAKVGVILSEGEQTCVALAAFLTELATAMHRWVYPNKGT